MRTTKKARHIVLDAPTVERLRAIGGTITRGIYLASFATDLTQIMRAEATHRTGTRTKPVVDPRHEPSPVKDKSYITPGGRIKINEIIADWHTTFRHHGYDLLLCDGTIEHQWRQEIQDGRSPRQLGLYPPPEDAETVADPELAAAWGDAPDAESNPSHDTEE